MTYRLPYPTYRGSYGGHTKVTLKDLKDLEMDYLNKTKVEFLMLLNSNSENEINAFIKQNLHPYKILQAITGLDLNDDEQYLQVLESYKYRFGLNDLGEIGRVLAWLLLNLIQEEEHNTTFLKSLYYIMHQRANETAGSGLAYLTETLYIETLKIFCANSQIKPAVSFIRNATIPMANHENWHEDQKYYVEGFYPIIDEVINNNLFRSKDEEWTFILDVYKLLEYDYKLYSISRKLFEYLQNEDFDKAWEIKKMLDKEEFDKEQLLKKSKSVYENNYNNDNYNDSRSHWDEYDEDGVPYSDYEW